jgi:DnaJ-class molecular chaperone
MKKQYLKTIGSTLIVGAFLFLAFGSDDSKSSSSDSSSSSSSSSSTSSKNTRTVYSGGYAVEIDLTPPAGYEEGSTCDQCDGGGVTSYNGSDMICPSCNGKGFKWRKK